MMRNWKTLSATGLLFLSIFANAQNENEGNSKEITEVVISKKKKKKYKNPAHEILDKLVAKKDRNNPENLLSYSAENHTRVEIAVSKLGDKFQNTKVYKDLKNIMDNSQSDLGAEQEAILPVFISENIADFYYQKNPRRTAEVIKKSKVEGVGVEDDTMFAQLISSTFIKYNFYNNYIRVLDKDFISPINDNFALQYDYELIDRDFIENERGYYKINFKPKRASDLAFEGTLLIDHSTYSLYKITAKIAPSANLNFINNVVIEQELAELEGSEVHMPLKSRVSVETAKLGKNGSSGLLNYYISSKDIKINQDFEEKLFKKSITFLPDAQKEDEDYWNTHRHDPLTTREAKMYAVIDEVKNLPSIKSYLDIIDTIISGYYNVGKIDLGPVLHTAGYSDVEGLRLRAGLRTSTKFSDKWTLGGYIGYGFKDKAVKYGAYADYIISREPWVQTGVSYLHDIGQTALQYENFSLKANNLFDAFAKNGDIQIRKPFWENQFQTYFQADFLRDFTQKISLRYRNFEPMFDFHYQGLRDFSTSEIMLETQWQPNRRTLEHNKNKKISVKGNVYAPTFTFRYTHGFKGILGSDFEYNKFHFNIQQTVPMGIFGRGKYSLTAGFIPNEIPYPLLENHLGNEFIFYKEDAFNMMRFFEFTSNKYASFQYTHDLQGLITNSLPLIKKWNWRNHLTFNYLIGDLEHKFNPDRSLNGLHQKPYIEVGYGISNIFRFLKIDFTHRLTHLQNSSLHFNSNPPKFSVKVSAQIRL